ncbi:MULTISPECIES: response regulator [unclassified Bartonella]|uniref:response regulator n=1 Tax=unclassified Bartonella TaxID=2645622 RepID=UPI0021C9ABC4|nr:MULTISPECIES: response regulator [unclassified Bartonella]UXN04952.1 winged helix-turn-helix domain-containing protein [Bartonella sp. HY406]UXN08007.1 winged helix-turn-helix domain-containing protein [Bartonella sp. HY761]
MNKNILIIEDDQRLADLVMAYLSKQGYDVTIHSRGDTAENAIATHKPDLVILDVMLPGKSGLDICRDARSFYDGLILIMTASEDDIDEIVGLELGADDYLSKPVEPRRLLAHIRALLRRKEGEPQRVEQANGFVKDVPKISVLHFGQLAIDDENRLVTLGDEKLEFTTAEFDLLWLLASQAGQILSRDDILNALRGIEFDGLDRSIDARVSRLRKRLKDDPDDPQFIKTVRAKGYLFLQAQER